MSIQGKVNEINAIKQELKNLRERGSFLRKRVLELEKDIQEYLEEKDQQGLKYKGVAIIRETKSVCRNKKKIEQENDTITILKNYGVSNPKLAFEEISKAKKGTPTNKTKLKYRNYKPD